MLLESFSEISILLISALMIITLLWSFLTIKNKRGFTILREKIDGSTTERKNWELGKNIIIQNIVFSIRLILIMNFIGFCLYKTWIFGENIGLGSIVLIIIVLSSEGVTSLYDWIKDESEKRHNIKETKKEIH